MSLLPLACAAAGRPVPSDPSPAEPVAPPRPALRCPNLGSARPSQARVIGSVPTESAGCDGAKFLADQVDLLIRGLEDDRSWGALVSPEVAAEGQLAVVANVVPALEYLRRRRSGQVPDTVHDLVLSIQKGLENELFRRTIALTLPSGETKRAEIRAGQLRGRANDELEYLGQAAQPEALGPGYRAYDAVSLEGRGARSGLLWTISATPTTGDQVEVEFRIRTFEIERSPEGDTLVVRGQMADRTAQLLGQIYTRWVGSRVLRFVPEVVEAAPPPEDPSYAAPPSDDRPPRRWLRLAIVRLVPRDAGGYLYHLGPGPLPRTGELFALLLVNPHAETIAFFLGASTAPEDPELAVTDPATTRSKVPAAPPDKVGLALSSVLEHVAGEGDYVLVLRRGGYWSPRELGQDRWRCDPARTYRAAKLPAASLPDSPTLTAYLADALAEQMGRAVEIAPPPDARPRWPIAAIPLDVIPDRRTDPAGACVLFPPALGPLYEGA